MKGVCLCVLWLVGLPVPCLSVPWDARDTGTGRDLHTSAGRWKRQDSSPDVSKPPRQGSATQDEDLGSVTGLTRLSLSEWQPSSSSQYPANCCDSVPELCSSAGKCALKVTDCVSFCICVRSPDLPWCADELRRLRTVLRQRGHSDSHRDGADAAGATEGGDSASLAGSGLQPATGSPTFRAGLSPNGTASGSPGLSSGLAGEDARSPEDNVMSSARPASSQTAATDDHPVSGHDDVTGDLRSTGTADQHAPPLAAMMNGGGETDSAAATELDAPHEDNASSSIVNNGTSDVLSQDDISNNDTEHTFLHHPPNQTQHDLNTTDSPHTTANTTATTTTDSAQIFIPWWPSDGGLCGMECELSGGRCVFEFNETHTEVCVYDDVQPCHQLNCVHGTCVTRNGSYSCECEEGWGGVFCSKECPLDCGQHGHCVVILDEVICSCDANYTGVSCGELKPTPPPWTGGSTQDDVMTGWQIAAGCLAVTAVLLLLLLLVAYVLWRRQWLPMRKLVHYFQQCEEDDGKEYDAFVSYRSHSRDEMFVLHELYPHLERHLDFKLCMHFRDFPPGETIADNIIHAIENSRRTILVLSPAYVQSEWCRLEYQKAQHEMLKLRHKIIPIMIEDVSHLSPVDRNLRAILDTVTYIQWPGNEDSKRLDKFWKLLQLSMPKKRSDYTRSLSSAESCGSDRPLTAVSSSCFSHVVNSMSESALQPQRSLSITSSLDEAAEEGEAAHGHSNTAATCCDSDQSSDSGCLRDRVPSSTSSADTPPDPRDTDCPMERTRKEEVTHVTSDDHIVEIREFPGNQVKVTPWVPARMSTRC